MSNLNGQIKVYPAAEMLAVDMAEALKAVSITNMAIIQGCRVSVNSSKDLTMTSGRILIFGRLGYFGGGTIPVPSVSGKTTCHVWAVCELSDPSYQFYVTVLTGSQQKQLQNKIGLVNDEFFNRNNGTRGLKLGTCVVLPGAKVESFTKDADASMTNGTALFNSLKSTVTKNNNDRSGEITQLKSSRDAHKKLIDNNAADITKLKTRQVLTRAHATSADATGITLKANETLSIYVVPGYTTKWPAKSNGTATEKQNYSLNESRASVVSNQLTNNHELFAGLIQFDINNSDVIVTGWNCITSTGKGTIKLKNLSSKTVKSIKVSTKALLIQANALERASKYS